MEAQERLTLDEARAPTLLGSMHVHRYELAAELCRGLRVVDVGCGTGYGSEILARACPAVLGLDRDERTIELARKELGDIVGLEFAVADAHDFLRNRLRERFDAMVMLETLEHLENPDDVLVSLHRHAQDGLKLIVSVPNSRMLEEENPHHVTSFGFDEATAAFDGFENARFLYQFIAEGSLIRDDGEARKGAVVLRDEGEREYANQFIALVNFDEAAAAEPSALMKLEAEPMHHRYVRGLEHANEALRRANARLARSRLGTADSAAASLVGRLRALEDELAEIRRREAEQSSEAHRRWIEHLHQQIADRERAIAEMQATRAWRLASRYWVASGRVKSWLSRA